MKLNGTPFSDEQAAAPNSGAAGASLALVERILVEAGAATPAHMNDLLHIIMKIHEHHAAEGQHGAHGRGRRWGAGKVL
jgi:hypothetical protein